MAKIFKLATVPDLIGFDIVPVLIGALWSFFADGLFGQCQSPHQEPVQYQVSVPVLHKLQEVLKDLMVQGE